MSVFLNEISHRVIDALNHFYQVSTSQRQAFITLIEKRTKGLSRTGDQLL